jgi:hypothetical protein
MPTLHDYQIVARDFLRSNSHAALLLDMGLGKTAASLSALEPRHLPVLVVAPKRVAEEVWDTEAALWRPDLRVVVAKGSPPAREAALLSEDADVIVLSRDNFRDVLTLKRKQPFRTLILDELSGFKSRQSVRWKTAMTVAWKGHRMEHVWGLTGTPAPNGYLDLWPQVAVLDAGERLGRNITTYRSRYFNPGRQLSNGTIIEWNLKPGAEDKIKHLISDVCLAMATDGRIKLPPTTFNYVPVELPAAVGTAYKRLEDDLIVDLRSIFDGEVHTAANAAVLSSRLSQMAAGFLYVDEAELHNYAYTSLHTAKVDALKEVLDSDHVGGVLVFYRYRAEAETLRRELASYGVRDINDPGVVKEWNAGQVPVLLAHPASAGHGLNLQHGGHTIVWTSLTWDLELWEQANKRLARQGQKHPVVIHCLMAMRRAKDKRLHPTVDAMIRDRLEGKADVQADLLSYLESPV